MSSLAMLRAEPQDAPRAAASTVRCITEVVRLQAQRLALWMEQVWRADRSSPDQGLAITPGEVAWRLAGDEAARQFAAFMASDARAVALTTDVDDAREALAHDAVWTALVHAFALSDAEADLLALAAAVEIDPGLQRVIAYLNDDARSNRPTPDLSARLALRSMTPWSGAALSRWRLATPLDEAPPAALTTAWRLDQAVMIYLRGGEWHDPGLAGAAVAAAVLDAAPLHMAALEALSACADLSEVELTGPRGIGRQTLAARHAVSRGQALLAVDLPLLLARGVAVRDALMLPLRQARIGGALAYFRDADAAPAAEWDIARRLGVPYLRGTRDATAGTVAIPLAPLTLGERTMLWRSVSDAPAPPALLTHRLTPGEIVRLATTGADAPHRPAGDGRTDRSLLTLLPCPYDWDDLILPRDVERPLREFADQVRLRWSVYDDWGFGRLAHLGYGISALFAGPSGTGKTMAAQVIARSLGLELYRVDLAGVVNKYIGETEKKLREVFDACEHSGALLFFDEADALFAGRMQVKDAHDRFANIETNYLLQRIETFDGVAILATNRRNDIDQAFIRRLRFVVEFLPPQPKERLALWRRVLRAASPSGEALLDTIDWTLLADQLPMTGAEIKNTVLAAAFLAKAEGCRIGMRHLLAAAERELTKQRSKLPASLRVESVL